MLDKNFTSRINRLGTPQNTQLLGANQISYAEKHLPKSYVDFLKFYGYGTFFNGGWQVVDPEEFRPLAALIFKADPDFSHKNTHIVGYSAFGELALWSEDYWVTDIKLLSYEVDNYKLAPSVITAPPLPASLLNKKRKPADANHVSMGLLPFEEDAIESWDFSGEPLFKRCIKQLGALEPGECYGFFPSLGMFEFDTKTRNIDHLKRVKALEHFLMIAQLKDFNLVRTVRGQKEIVRRIG